MSDLRSTDWIYYTSVTAESEVQIIGYRTLIEYQFIIEKCKHCTIVVNSSRKKDICEFLGNKYSKRYQIINVDEFMTFKNDENKYDMTIFYDCLDIRKLIDIKVLIRLLMTSTKKEGQIILFLSNSLYHLFTLNIQGIKYSSSYRQYITVLASSKLKDFKCYLPLPFYNNSSLFIVPVSTNVLSHFLEYIYPLTKMVSTEVKRSYGVKYIIANKIFNLIKALSIETFVKYIASGYLFIIKNEK
jgi:hypothetical protein